MRVTNKMRIIMYIVVCVFHSYFYSHIHRGLPVSYILNICMYAYICVDEHEEDEDDADDADDDDDGGVCVCVHVHMWSKKLRGVQQLAHFFILSKDV